MSKLKEIWGWVVAGVVGAVGLFLYFFSRRGDEINALKAKINLASTEKQSDAIETEIKQAQERKDNIAKQRSELDKTMSANEAKREDIKKKTSEMKDPKEIADYWNKQ